MHTHEPQPSGGQTQGRSSQANPFERRSFEVTYPGQEIASSPTNPFPRRPHEVWMGESHIARKAAPVPHPDGQTDPESKRVAIDWNRVSLYAPGQPSLNSSQRKSIQPKRTVGESGDRHEQEGDRAAEQAMSMVPPATPNVQQQTEEEIQTTPLAETITPLVQRQGISAEEAPLQTKCEACEAEEQIQRSSNSSTQAFIQRGGGNQEAANLSTPFQFIGDSPENLNVSVPANSQPENSGIPKQGITGPLPVGTYMSGEDWVLDQWSEDEMMLEVGGSMLSILSDEDEHYGYFVEPRTTPTQQVVRVVATPGVVVTSSLQENALVSLVVHTREVTSPDSATTQLDWGVMEMMMGEGRQFSLDHSSVSISVPEEPPGGFLKGEFPNALYAYYLAPEWTGEDNKEKEIHIVATPGVFIDSWQDDPLSEVGGNFARPLIASGYGRRLIPRVARVQNPALIPAQGTEFRAEDFLAYQNFRPDYSPPIGGENMESVDVYTGSSGVTIQHPYTNTTLNIRAEDSRVGASFAYQVLPPTDENMGEIRVIVGPGTFVELVEEEPPSNDTSYHYQGKALAQEGRTDIRLLRAVESKHVPPQGTPIDFDYYLNQEGFYYDNPDKHTYIPRPEDATDNLAIAAVDVGIGSIPIIGDIIDIGEFFLALITDKDKWGRKVDTTDKIIMGLGALIGLIPFVGGVGSAARKVGKAALEIAQAATRMGKSVEQLEVILGNLRRVISKADDTVIRRAEKGLREGGEVAAEDLQRISRLTEELGGQAQLRAQMNSLRFDSRLHGYNPVGVKVKGSTVVPETNISSFTRRVSDLPGNHKLKYLNDGRVFLCSPYCTDVTEFANTYADLLKQDAGLQKELAEIADISDETARLARLNQLEDQVKNFGQAINKHENLIEDLPFTYKPKPFKNFVNLFFEEFKKAGFGDVQGFMQGSAASGYKFNNGNPIKLDAKKGITPNDYDVAIVSPAILKKAEELKIIKEVLKGQLTDELIARLRLSEAQQALTKASKGGRPVNFKVYKSVQDVYNYDKTIPFSAWKD